MTGMELVDARIGFVHLRIQKRSGRKSITTVQGLTAEQAKDCLKELRKLLCCNGSLINDDEFGLVLQLQGDQRDAVRDFLVSKFHMNPNSIKVHGY